MQHELHEHNCPAERPVGPSHSFFVAGFRSNPRRAPHPGLIDITGVTGTIAVSSFVAAPIGI
jgi:hypothetical protein